MAERIHGRPQDKDRAILDRVLLHRYYSHDRRLRRYRAASKLGQRKIALNRHNAHRVDIILLPRSLTHCNPDAKRLQLSVSKLRAT
jgi:hypothetical protein